MEMRKGWLVKMDYGNWTNYLGGRLDGTNGDTTPWIFLTADAAQRSVDGFMEDIREGKNTMLQSASVVPCEYMIRLVPDPNPADPHDGIRQELEAMAAAGETR